MNNQRSEFHSFQKACQFHQPTFTVSSKIDQPSDFHSFQKACQTTNFEEYF
jgi:hypothetical protein